MKKRFSVTLSFIILVLMNAYSQSQLFVKTLRNDKAFDEIKDRKWWKEAVVYQIYPRSFKDSDGDGVGDLNGIISKLDYIKSLGIDVVWLNPIYASPNDDNGYDISDYENIMKEFGSIADFDSLLSGMHKRGIKLVMDLVVNHSSDEHEWFKQSRSSRTNLYRDYYHWWPAEKGEPSFRQSFFDVDGKAWKYDATTNAYYLHYFSRKQPDLNWENPKLREEIFQMMRNWFDKGVDGFRMDVIPFISKDTTFPHISKEELKEAWGDDWSAYYGHGPHLHKYLQQMNSEVLSKYDVMTLAEAAGSGKKDGLKFVDPDRKELDMMYHFEGVSLGYNTGFFKEMDPNGYSLPEFKKIYSEWDSVFAEKGWGTIYLGNHDQPRMLTRWGNDAANYREFSSKLLTTFLLTMRGTPYYYQGDELGMYNIKFDDIANYRDIESLNMYEKLKVEKGDLNRFIAAQKIGARDNGRTPFQWNSGANAGFTTGKPWIKVNPNYATLNAAAQEKDPNSTLNYFRKILALRKKSPALIYGAYKLYDDAHTKVYAYTRIQGKEKILVLLNFSNEAVAYKIPAAINYQLLKTLLNNYSTFKLSIDKKVTLSPWQAIVLSIN